MNFERLMTKVRKSNAYFNVELALCNDVYRLAYLIEQEAGRMRQYAKEAKRLRDEVEHGS